MLQHALRIGVRRHPCSRRRVLRALNTSVSNVSASEVVPTNVEDPNGILDDSISILSEREKVGRSDNTERAKMQLASVEIRPSSTHVEVPCASQARIQDTRSKVACKSLQSSLTVGNIPKKGALFSTVVDVDSLRPHEMTVSSKEADTMYAWVEDAELRGVLKMALTRPVKRTNDRLVHPVTPQELELRLYQALTFTPLPSLSRLINYHDCYPLLQSAASYTFLVQFAIRHTSYSKAFQLLRQMEAMSIKPDDNNKLLYVRLLVRIGQWNRAWSYVRQELPSRGEKSPLPLLLELLGYHKPVEFGEKPLPDDSPDPKATQATCNDSSDGVQDASVRDGQKSILAVIPKYLSSKAPPTAHFILTVIRHLLHDSHTETARALTMEWISHLPKQLSLPRKRQCMSVLHLHLAISRKTLQAHVSNRQFTEVFFRHRPDLRPNSTTLFLLLRSLTRAKGKPTFHALQLVHAFHRKWGSDVVDSRVRRRIASIAVREGRLHVARTWLDAEDQASGPKKLATLQKEVVGTGVVKPPQRTRRYPFQKLMPASNDENRKWRWLKRRFWRREQSRVSKESQSQMVISIDPPDSEKEVAE